MWLVKQEAVMNFTNNRLNLAVLLLSFALLIGAGVVMAGDTSAAANEPPPPAMAPGVTNAGYYLSTTVSSDFATTVEHLRAALASEGFGVLTEVDMQAKFKEKLDEDIPPYLILGACNPPLANAVYQREDWIGILLPCNFVVRELSDGTVMVGAQNPLMLPEATGNAELEPLSRKLTTAVGNVLSAL